MALSNKLVMAIVVGTLLFSMMTFGTLFLGQNNALDEINDTPEYGLVSNVMGDFAEKLESNSDLADNQLERFNEDFVEQNTLALVLNTIFSVGNVFTGLITGIYRTFILLPAEILGVPPIMLAVASSILIIGIIFSRWRSVK